MAKAKTDVATVSDQNQLPADMLAEMEADAKYAQHFDAAQLTIPRINILQDLSPQCKHTHAEFMEGARPGLFYHNVLDALDETIKFIPSSFKVMYIAWRPRKAGGGLVSQDLTLEEVEENFERVSLGQWRGHMKPRPDEEAVSVEVIETPTWVGYATGKTWGPMPVAISFPSTKSKAARKINSQCDMATMVGANGQRFTPATFWHEFELGSILENRGDDSWFGFTIQRTGWVADEYIRNKAKELKISYEGGEAAVADDVR